MRDAFLVLLSLPLLATACKKDSGGPTYPETFCSPGETRCLENYQATCGDDGKAWNTVFCGANQFCEAGACKARACTPAGKSECVDAATLAQCSDNGGSRSTVACGAKEACVGGACVASPCNAGDTKCVFDTLVTCTGGGWTAQACGAGQACKGNACAPKACPPEEARCATERVAILCNLTGTDFLQTPCAAKDHCVDGFCVPIVANPPEPVPDTSLPDVPAPVDPGPEAKTDSHVPDVLEELPLPEVSIPGENKATVDGVTVEFYLMHDANWISKDSNLMINLMSSKMDGVGLSPDGSKHNLEIHVIGITEGQVGTFKCAEASTASVSFWYRWGKYTQGEECKDFDYAAETCTVTLEKFDAKGGKVEGTFTNVKLIDCKKDGTEVKIENGVFSAERQT